MINPGKVVFFKPSKLSRFKSELFDRVGGHIVARGGKMVLGDVKLFNESLNEGSMPVVGCMPEMTDSIIAWRDARREFCYWDRGYL